MKLENGSYLSSPEDIHMAIVDYFSEFFKKESPRLLPDLSTLITLVISVEESDVFCKSPTLDEVHDSLFSIPSNSAPGPDGFGSGIYKSCWDLVKYDILEAIS